MMIGAKICSNRRRNRVRHAVAGLTPSHISITILPHHRAAGQGKEEG